MNTKLLIVADLGLFRAYREIKQVTDRPPRLELIDELKPEAAHRRQSDQLTDRPGRFPRGGGAGNISGDLSAGERLSLEEEQARRLIGQLAGRINELLADEEVAACSLAASPPIHRRLVEALAPKSRAKIGQVLAANLTKTAASELREHFTGAS